MTSNTLTINKKTNNTLTIITKKYKNNRKCMIKINDVKVYDSAPKDYART